MPVAITSIRGVSAKTVRRKSDGRELTIYEIEDTDGFVWGTTRKNIAQEANRLIGQSVELDGRIEYNGTFENRYLEGVKPAETSAFSPPRQAARDAFSPLDPEPFEPTPPPGPMSAPTEKDWSIWRQTAAKVAGLISESADQFWHNVDDLVEYFKTGTKPTHSHDPLQNQFIPQSAIQDPGPDPYVPPVTDDDIPF